MVARVIQYDFVPATRKVTLKNVQTVDVSRVQYIVNTTKGITLYDYSDPSIGTITLDVNNVIILSHSTARMVYTDELDITYDFPIEPVDQNRYFL